MTNSNQHHRRLGSLRARIARPQDAFERCAVYPCANQTTAHAREGLNRLYCRKHIEFYRRHGSYSKRSYSAGELRPYRTRALNWLKQHRDHAAVEQAVDDVLLLYHLGDRPVEAFRLSGKAPAKQAKATWAQLREQRTDPLEVLAAWMAVELRLQDDPQPDRHDEYRQVQVAKLIRRMAGGAHKRWEHERPDGSIAVTSLHKYPASRGRVLRHLGEAMARAIGSVQWSEMMGR